MDQLYLIEILVDKIMFAPSNDEVPQKNDINIFVTFGNMANLEIEPEGLRKDYIGKIDPFKHELDIDAGKSYLFPSKAENLLKAMNQSPLEVCLTKQCDESPIGRVTIPWTWEFTDMVDRSRFSPDNLIPAMVKGDYEIFCDSEDVVGEIGLFVRLSCLGQNIQTQFQVVQRKGISGDLPPKKFLFKSSNADTTFQARKYGEVGESTEMLPIAPLYNPSDPKWKPKAPITPADMTAEKINEVLCKNRDCPGVQKFKEFGLGPAATGKGLGTLYGPTEVPISYGMSHTYGNLEHYGPYGVYMRQKSLEEPFTPREPISCSNTSGCENCGQCKSDDGVSTNNSSQHSVCACCAPLKTRRGSPNENAGCGCATQCMCCGSEPLRLNGGSPAGDDENKMPEPMMMCKDLMQSFDKVLNEYKKALGPCGQVICPFAPNVVAETCKQLCKTHGGGETEHNRTMTPTDAKIAAMPKNDGSMSACGLPGCLYSRKPESATDKAFQQKQMKSACGSPTCPFTKNKLGTATDDDMLEIQLMDGPSVAKSCGSPKCPFPISPGLPPLEPIHWDCPDPLPKGPCRNPQCPLKPPELRYNLVPKGPCGSSKCPYATPAYCGDPNCPFGPPQPCPYAEPPPCPPSSCVPECGNPCGMPPCSPPPCQPPPCAPLPCCCRCGNPSCPASPPTCGDPYCPLNPSPLPCPGIPPPCMPPPCMPPPTSCGGPSCPYSSASPKGPCGSADCPYAVPPPTPTGPCGDPACPFASRPSTSSTPCGNPSCPFAKSPTETDSVVCDNPECPFKTKSGNSSVCANPECPFASQKSNRLPATESPCYIPPISSTDSPCYIPAKDSVCSNPNCPYASPPSTAPPPCGKPTCPLLYPCKMQVGGTKVTVEYGGNGNKDVLPQETGYGDGETEYTKGDRDMNIEPCSPRTCKTQGGNLECAECAAGGGEGQRTIPCPCGGTITLDESPNASKEAVVTETDIPVEKDKQPSYSAPAIGQKPKKELQRNSASEKAISKSKGGKGGKKPKSKFVYKLGDLYPGVHIGHRECIIPGRNVPAKMGWLWNVHTPCSGLKPRIGWRPGAVGRTIAKRIIAHRKAKGLKLLEPLTPKASRKKVKAKYSDYESDSDVTVAPKPTLSVKKREGCYYITMNPLKDPKTIEDNENPYMDCTPMQFKITRSKDKKEEEEKTCSCGEEEGEESSDSELDIEFTPPAGIIRPERLKRKKNVVHTDTQYDPEDFATKDKDKGKGKGKGKDKGKGGKGKKGKK